jgi:hypothetical protein
MSRPLAAEVATRVEVLGPARTEAQAQGQDRARGLDPWVRT